MQDGFRVLRVSLLHDQYHADLGNITKICVFGKTMGIFHALLWMHLLNARMFIVRLALGLVETLPSITEADTLTRCPFESTAKYL